MVEIGSLDNNPFWFVDESQELMEYTEGGLANHIFELVESRVLREHKEIISTVIEASPVIAEFVKGLKKTQSLKIVFSDEVKRKMADGTYRLMERKDLDGVFKAIVIDSKGKTQAIADLKWEEIPRDVDLGKLVSAMQGMAIQQQLHEITEQLEDMSVAMEEVLMGQHNDRLAMFFSGEAIYREALATTDPERKKQLTTAAIVSLTNAAALIQTTLASEINGICDKYDVKKRIFTGIKVEKIREKMLLINSSFQVIHKIMTLKAAIYYKEREYAMLTTVLMDYKSFLERSLSQENAHVLYLADPCDKNIYGSWNNRQNELPARIEKARELLSKPADYELEVQKGETL